MKKLCKYLLCLSVIVCCLIGIGVNAQAATTVDSGICGVDLTWTLDSNGKLTISGTGEMTDSNYYWQGGPWRDRDDITSVVIKSGVTGIGNYSFTGCKNLISVTIPSSVKRVGESAFRECNSLKSVKIPNGVINGSAFWGCSSLTTVEIGNGVTSIGEWAFNDCENLSSLTIGNSVTTIDADAFKYCTSLKSVTIPKSVTTIGDSAFSSTSLKTIAIPNSVTSLGKGAFSGCTSLTSVSIPNSLTVISGGTFNGCVSLASISIPSSIEVIEYQAFADCGSLTSVTIPNSVKTVETSAFYGCDNLNSVWIGNGVSKLDSSAFSCCTALRKITFTGSAPEISWFSFDDVVAAVYYPKNDSTWTEDVCRQYYGVLTWIPYTPLEIKTQPKTAYALIGDSAKVSVKAAGDGLTYQWYIKNASASSYTKSSVTTATYSCKMSSTTDGRYVRCKITDKYGNSVWTNTVRLQKLEELTVATQPANKTVKAGTTAKFTVKATGTGLNYQWQYRTSSSGSWKNASATGNKTKTLSVAATAAKHGYQYRCKITDAGGNVIYTKVVNLYVLGIKTQPVNKSVVAGKTAKFTVAATGKGLTYQWYYRTSSSGSWKATSATGNKTKTLSISATTAKHGYQYRCKITDSAGNVLYTKVVNLYVLGIKTQPVNKTVKAGATAKFTVKATGKGLTYQWQYRTSSSGSWKNVSTANGKTANYSLTAATRHNGYQYRCKITDSAGNVLYTNTVKLTVK